MARFKQTPEGADLLPSTCRFNARQISYIGLRVQGLTKSEAARQAGYVGKYAANLERLDPIRRAIEDGIAKKNERVAKTGIGRAVGSEGTARPPAAQLLDGIPSQGGPLADSAFASRGQRDLGQQLARDLSTCTFDEIEKRWSGSARSEAEGIMERPWRAIASLDHHPVYWLAERCWFDNVKTKLKYLYAPYHRDLMLVPITDYILDPTPPVAGILFLGPRFTYKTTFSHGAIPQWYVLRGAHLQNVHYAVVLRHHKLELASDNLVRLKAKHQSHPWMRSVWPDACAPENTRDFGTSQRFTLPWVPPGQTADPSFRAIGLGASDTGRHPDLDMGDDLVTEEHLSKVVRDEAKRRYRAKRYQLDLSTGREVNTGTPYHRMDLWAMMLTSVLDSKPLYKVVQIPAHLPESLQPKYGLLAHPHKLSEAALEKRRLEELATAGNDDFYYLQFEVTYRLSRQQTTQAWWIRDCLRDEIPEDGIPLITVDPAWKGDKNYGEGDSASIQVWVLVRRGALTLRYLVDGVHSNELSSSDGEREIFRLMERYGVVAVAPEIPQGSTFRANLIQTAASLGRMITIIDLKSKQVSKPDRIGGFLKECEAGRVFVSKECDPVLREEFRSQFDNWPQVDHEDALDAAAYTCDPAILESWAPVWGAGRQRSWRTPRVEPETYRTRYTTI